MNRLLSLTFLVALTLARAFAQETAVGTSTITFGTGGGWTGNNPLGSRGGPALNGTYEYRIWKYLALEFGVHNTLVTVPRYGYITSPISSILPGFGLSDYTYSSLTTSGSARNTTVPFGFRGILPLRHGKIELFLAGDAAYTWNTQQSYEAWGAEGRTGVRFAVDKQRHFWLGTSGQYLQEMGYASQHWVVWTADFGYRFGK